MRHLKLMALMAVAATAIMAFIGVGSASAEVLWTRNSEGTLTTVATGTALNSSLESKTSALLKDTGGLANDTCTSSTVEGKVETNSGGSAGGKVSNLTFTGCSHTTTVLAPGSLSITNAGKTNGTVVSSGARVTIKSTVFGISCVANTGAGTVIGTLTGAATSTDSATMDINGVISLENGCGDSTWTGSYLVTSPLGLVVE